MQMMHVVVLGIQISQLLYLALSFQLQFHLLHRLLAPFNLMYIFSRTSLATSSILRMPIPGPSHMLDVLSSLFMRSRADLTPFLVHKRVPL